MDSEEAGRLLARRHHEAAPSGGDTLVVDAEAALSNYPEVGRAGDWSLRSALVRLAQPDPVRVSALLDVTRRLDAALHHAARTLERHPARCDRALTFEALTAGRVEQPVIDARAADLGRLVAAGAEPATLLDGYQTQLDADGGDPLDPIERVAVPLLAVAVTLDGLAERLASWADHWSEDPPVGEVDRVTVAARDALDALGVPEETGPPPGARSRG